MRRTSVRSLCLCCALAWLVAAGCGGDDSFTDAAPGPDGPTVDAVTVDAMEDAAAPDADVTAPDTTITDAPADPDNDATPTFAFTSDDAGATFECRVDNQTFAPCTSPHTTGALADGAHTFEVRAVDGEDNTDATAAAHAWTVDTDAPETLIETAPPPLDNSPDVTFAFVADEAGSTFECRVDGDAFAPCASPHTVLDLPDGERTFAVRAIDPAGNVDVTPATYDWTLDATTPNTVIDSGPPDPDNEVAATFTFSSPNVGVGGTFACALDGGAFAACTSPHTVAGLAEGEHTFAVRVTDGAGNPDPTPAERAWEVDLTPPDTTLTATPDDPTSQPAGTFAFSSEAGATFACENLEGQPGYRPAPAGRPAGGYVPVGERPPEPPPKISKVDVGLLLGAPYRVETMSGVEDATGVTTGFDLRIQTGTMPEIGGEIVVGLQYSRVSTAHYPDDRSMVFVPWLIGLTSTPRLYRGKREVRLDLGFDVGGLSRVGCGDCEAEGLPTHAFLMVARGGFDVYSGATLDSGWGIDAVMQWSRHGDTGADPAAIAVVSPALLVRLSFGGKVRETGATW